MRNYREYLRVPASYWILGGITMVTFATMVWGGFNLLVAAGVYVVLLGGPGAALLWWGHTSVEVSDGELRAGRATLPLAQAGQVQALDESQTRQMRGPLADPSAFMMTRPYLRCAVYVEVTGDHPARPYWLIGAKKPEALAAAIERSRPQVRAEGPSMA